MEGVVVEFGEIEAWRTVEVEAAIDLPPRVAEHPRAVAQEGMAVDLPLRPIARIVRANDAIWPGHADESAEPDERAGEPARRLEGAVDHHPVIADAMPKQQRRAGRDKKEGDSARRQEGWTGG